MMLEMTVGIMFIVTLVMAGFGAYFMGTIHGGSRVMQSMQGEIKDRDMVIALLHKKYAMKGEQQGPPERGWDVN